MLKEISTKILGLFDKVERTGAIKGMHLARKKFISLFVFGMIECGHVQFTQIGAVMETTSKTDSNVRRIQDFFANYRLDYRQLALTLFFLVPQEGEVELMIDRTNWKFGGLDVNFLVISVHCRGVGVPIWFELLEDKSGGNSNTGERKTVLRQVLKLLKGRDLTLYGDREFIGEEWVGFLLKSQIRFFLRVKINTRVEHEGEDRPVLDWLGRAASRYLDDVLVWGHRLSIGMKMVSTKSIKSKDRYLFVLTNTTGEQACEAYRKRWSIEVFFQSIKGRGFNFEQTHLQDLVRLRKLFAMAALAFAICLNMGIWWNDTIKKIKIKNHGYKRNSFFRFGKDRIREAKRLRDFKLIEQFLVLIEQLLHRIALPEKGASKSFLT